MANGTKCLENEFQIADSGMTFVEGPLAEFLFQRTKHSWTSQL